MLLTLTAVLPVGAQEPPAPGRSDRELAQAIAEYMAATSALGHFSGSVLVARQGRVLHRRGYGFADVEHRVGATAQTKYRIASITKQFAAAAVLLLREQGKLTLDDPVARHLEGLPASWVGITLRHLLNHTSGIVDYEKSLGMESPAYADFMAPAGVPRRIVDFAKAAPLEFEPGSDFHYCNSSYVLLGYVIEKVSGRPLADFLRRSLFEPLGLLDTGHDAPQLLLPHRATGYVLKEGWTLAEFYAGYALDGGMLARAPYVRLEPPLADGGLYSTVDDLYRWDRALASGAVLSPESREEMTTPGLGSYGFGWFVGERYGQRRIWHTGVLPGFISFFDRYPQADATVIVLGNTDVSPERISDDLAAILFGQPYALPEPHRLTEITAAEVAPLAGRYRSADGRTFEVGWDEMPFVAEDDKFMAGMFAKSATEFYVPMFRGTATFVRDDEGVVRELVAVIRGQPRTLYRIEDQ